MRNNKGITLIALVITIIVLLILAGVSIAMLTGDNGILNQATRSQTQTAKAEAEEAIKLGVNEILTNSMDPTYNTTGGSENTFTKTNLENVIKRANANVSSVTATASTGGTYFTVTATVNDVTATLYVTTDGNVTTSAPSESH